MIAYTEVIPASYFTQWLYPACSLSKNNSLTKTKALPAFLILGVKIPWHNARLLWCHEAYHVSPFKTRLLSARIFHWRNRLNKGL